MMKNLLTILALLSFALGKNILLSNDDGWTSTEIRAVYRDLKKAGHTVIMVAPVRQMSGNGGKFDVPKTNKLESDGEFGYVKKGDPAWDYDHSVNDKNIWYFDGTPSSCISFAFDYLLPKEFSNVSIDLVVAGVNQGPNVSPGFYTASGTMGATYSSIYRGYPAISFSGFNLANSFFKDSLNDDKYNSANIYSSLVVDFVNEIVKNDPIMPKMQGVNVNFPKVGDLNSNKDSCTKPEWQLTRLMENGIFSQVVKHDDDKDTFSWDVKYFDNIETDCNLGDACKLSGEYNVFIKLGCTTTVSAFSADYSVNSKLNTQLQDIFNKLK